jgi:hypothetical protein
MTWTQSLDAVRITGETLQLTTRPGCHELRNFVTEPRRNQLAKVIESIIGRPLRVQWAADRETDEPARSGPPEQEPDGPGGDMRQQAMDLPLVREIMDLFGATLVDVRPQYNQTPGDASGEGSEPSSEETRDDVQ